MTIFRPLPVGGRGGLSASKTTLISTPLPDSKIVGDPSEVLLASVKVPVERVINPLAPQSNKPPGAFEAAYNGREISRVDFRGANADRLKTEHADRIARTRSAAKVPVLGTGSMSGWDWIRFGRRIAPALPGGFRGHVAVVGAHNQRGTQAMQLEMPVLTVEAMADAGKLADTEVMTTVPYGRSTVPMLSAPVSTTVNPPSASTFDWAYLIGALVVVFLILKVR